MYATVSRDNYKYFVAILFNHMAAYSTFMVTSCIYWYYASLSWGYIVFMIYRYAPLCSFHFLITAACTYTVPYVSLIYLAYYVMLLVFSTIMALLIFSLLSYHLKILGRNVTTNEDINSFRYPHFRDEQNNWSNPFDKGSPWKNTMDGLFPSKKLYYTREEVLQSQKPKSSQGNGFDEDDHEEGFFEESRSKLLV